MTITITPNPELPMWDWEVVLPDGRGGAWSAVTRTDALSAACAWAKSLI